MANLDYGYKNGSEYDNKSMFKYGDKIKDSFKIWDYRNDEYYDEHNSDVIECYGI